MGLETKQNTFEVHGIWFVPVFFRFIIEKYIAETLVLSIETMFGLELDTKGQTSKDISTKENDIRELPWMRC